MFRSLADRRFAIRRVAALLGGLALLYALTAPAVSACGLSRMDDVAMTRMDHDAMPGRGMDEAPHHSLAVTDRDASATVVTAVTASGCQDSYDCAAMTGCAARVFVAADGVEASVFRAQSRLTAQTQHGKDLSTAPDHPPPRA